MTIGEQIIVWLLVLPFVALLSVIVEARREKRGQKRRKDERAEAECVIAENRQRLAAELKTRPSKPVVRGYDSSELFRKDALIWIRKLEEEIAAGDSLKSESKKDRT